MSNIKKLAPYVYLAKRNDGSGKYDFFLLVPVGQAGDTNLANVNISTEDPKKILITYPTSTDNANVIFRTRRFEVEATEEMTYLRVADDNNQFVMDVELSDADETPGTQNADHQTFAPYLFSEIESGAQKNWLHSSCIVLYDNGLTISNESIVFGVNHSDVTFDIESNNSAVQPENFVTNQKIKAEMAAEEPFTVSANINGNNNYNKPPRSTKVTKIWHT